MNVLTRLRALLRDAQCRLRALFTRAREDRELDEELAFHLEQATRENVRRGMSKDEARRQARLRLGGPTQVREAVGDARGARWIEALGQDLRYAFRGLRANPLFTLAIVLTLGLGVGASSAMFAVVDALLIRPLPYAEPDRMVEIWSLNETTGRASIYVDPDFAREWAEHDELFSATFQHSRMSALYTEGAEPVTLTVQLVTPGFVGTTGVRPALGRGFQDADAVPGAVPVTLLSHGFWRSAYGGDPGIVGRSIELEGVRHEVIGVMPPHFKFPEYGTTDAWIALPEDNRAFGRVMQPIEMVGRLRGDLPLDVLQDRADALAVGLAEAVPREGGWLAQLEPFGAMRRANENIRRAVGFLAGAVGLIALVATLNAVNLMLVRGWSRTRELAVRVALGASRRRLIGQLLTESGLLAAASGVVAVVLAFVVLRLIQGILPGSITFWAPYAIAVEKRTLLFTFASAAVVGLVIGLIPALLSTRSSSAAAGGALTAYAARTPSRSRLRRSLVIAEVALSVTLLVGAGLFIHSFAKLNRVDPGFRLDNVAILSLSLSGHAYPDGEARMSFLRELEERIETIPGVVGATTGGASLPGSGITFSSALETDAGTVEGDGQAIFLSHTNVSPDFFDLFEVRALAGRVFGGADLGTNHVLVSSSLARLLWGDENPIGRQFRPSAPWEWQTVVGVVDDLKLRGPEAPYGDFVFLMPASNTASAFASVAIRTAGDPSAYFDEIRSAIYVLDANQPVQALRTARDVYTEEIDMPRFLLVVMGALSAIALALAAVGVYGVLAYAITQRRFDLGVRIALGAEPATLSRRVIGEGLALAGIGAVIGVGGALALSNTIRGLLFDVDPGDPTTMAAVIGVIMLAAAAAAWWPARRVARIDPVEALRVE